MISRLHIGGMEWRETLPSMLLFVTLVSESRLNINDLSDCCSRCKCLSGGWVGNWRSYSPRLIQCKRGSWYCCWRSYSSRPTTGNLSIAMVLLQLAMLVSTSNTSLLQLFSWIVYERGSIKYMWGWRVLVRSRALILYQGCWKSFFMTYLWIRWSWICLDCFVLPLKFQVSNLILRANSYMILTVLE
jgi:hypothetical protein